MNTRPAPAADEAAIAASHGDYERAVSAGRQARARYQQLGDGAGEAETLSALSIADHRSGWYRDALNAGQQTQAAARAAGAPRLECRALMRIAMAHERLDDPPLPLHRLHADAALYEAKRGGRNRVVLHAEQDFSPMRGNPTCR